MSHKSNIEIQEIRWDRHCRTTKTTINLKSILTPCYVAHIKSASEFEIYYEERTNVPRAPDQLPLNHVSACLLPYYLGDSTLVPKLDAINHKQETLTGAYAYRPFVENTAFGYDPYSEYMVLSWHFEDILKSKRTPKVVAEYAKKIQRKKKSLEVRNKDKKNEKTDAEKDDKEDETFPHVLKDEHIKFWKEIDENNTKRNAMIMEDFKHAKQMGADFYLTRHPMIDSMETYEIAIRQIEKSKALWEGDVATFLLCSSEVLDNNKVLQQIIHYITEDPSRLTAFKFKYLDLTDLNKHTQFENYMLLLKEINGIRKAHPEKSFMIFENYYQCYASAVAGFDYVSTSLRGFDGDGRFGKPKEEGKGRWLHPKKLILYRHSEVCDIFETNGKSLPCECRHSKAITDLKALTREFWNTYRKRHALLTWNRLMHDLRAMVIGHRVEEAREKVLEDSRLKLFKELIPTY